MFWCVLWAVVVVVGVGGLLISINNLRFAREVAREVTALWSSDTPLPRVDAERLQQLPALVRDYLAKALGEAPRAARSVRFRHSGRFRTKLDAPWQRIHGEQYDAAAPPGFVWWGRLRIAPGVWVDARDRALNGVGNMFVSLESSFTLFDVSGPQMDQGSLLRLLSELVLLPGALADERYVTWVAVDASHARATLRLHATEVTGTFEFGADGLPASFAAERYFDSGQGQAQLLPWSGTYEDYRRVNGLLVPHHLVAYWHVGGERVPYVDFLLETPEYDPPGAF